MRSKRITIGLLLVVTFVVLAGAGVVVLRESFGGGLQFSVTFKDTHSLEVDDDVIYGDKIVGRVTGVKGDTVYAVVETDKANLVHEGSRFWIVSNIVAFLQFDTPAHSGTPVSRGHSFDGFETRPDPDPDSLPPQQLHQLPAIPAWLCEVRATIKTVADDEAFLSIKRKSTAAVLELTDEGHAIVIAPSWIHEVSGDIKEATFLVELQSDETRLAELIETNGKLSRFMVRDAGYKGPTAKLYTKPLPDKQTLVLTNHDGGSYKVKFINGQVDLRLTPKPGLLALVDGYSLAGFATPVRGERYGVLWVSVKSVSSSEQSSAD